MRRSVQMRMVALLGWALVSGVAWAVPVSYTNDFGTNAQLNELMWFKTDAPNTSQSPSVYPSANDPYTGSSFVAMDLNLDTMARILYVTTLANVDATGVRPFSADPFKVYDNITVSGSAGSGYPNYTTSTTGVILSATRTGYDQTSYAADYTMQAVSINGNSSINGTPRFWAGAKVTRNNAYGFDWGVPTGNGYYYSRFAELEVSADERDPAAGEQVLLTNNDFGTTAQQNAWTVTGTASPLFFASNAGDLNGDLNNDYLAGGIRFAGSTNQERTGTLSVVLRVDAPEGTAFKSIVGMANAWAYSSWGSSARLELSKDGVNYDVVGNTATNGACSLEVKSFGVEGYQALKSVWLKIYMNDNYGFDISGDHLYVDNVILTGELVSLLMTTNDLGTTAQRNEWSISGSATPAFFANNGDDLDGDNLASGIRFAGSTNQERTGILSAVLKVDAPFGNVFKNIKATADAWAYSSWGSYARLELSKDGINFDIVGDTLGTGPGSLVVDSTGITGYETVSSIWLKIYMQDNYGFDINGSYLYVDNIMLTGEWICPAPREPLTYRDSGLYCGWNDYFLRVDTPFNFFTVQAVAWEGDSQSNINWNTWLQNARQNGKRIIADLIPQAKDANNNWYGISGATDNASLDKLVAVVDEFFEEVDVNDVYAVTLGEEQIFWDGQAARLNSLYDKIKAKYDVPIYQWYSPSYTGSIPGLSWPNIKADGWMADEYYMDQPDFEKGMRGYTVLQKPIIQTIWAGGEAATVPFYSTRFWAQNDVCEKYNIPTSYFTWYGSGGAWGWSDYAPASLKATFDLVLQAANAAKSYSGPDTQTWDTVPWTVAAIPLTLTASNSSTACYREVYSVERGVRFANEAAISGFVNLRWDSTAVELRPHQAGSSQASVSYKFQSPSAISQLIVTASGFITAGRSASASMSVLDSNDNVVMTGNLSQQGTWSFVIPGANFSGTQFKVVFNLSGTAQSAGDVLAGINFLDVVSIANPVLYNNDFGTSGQLNELLWFPTATPATYSTTFPTTVSVSSGVNDPYTGSSFIAPNLDGDGLAKNLYVTTTANVDVTGVRPFSATPFKVYDNIKVNGYAASGYPYPETSTTGVILSATRTGYDQTSYASEYNSLQTVSITGGSSINGTPRFWAGAKVKRTNAYGYDVGAAAGYYYSRLSGLQVSATERDPATGERVLLTGNDFGTTTQQNAWTVSGTATPLFISSQEGDLNNDLLANRIRFAGSTNQERTGNLSVVLKVDAPSGKTFTNIRATADAWAYSSWGSSARLELSKDGVTYDVVGNTLSTGLGSLSVDSTGVSGYENVSSVWLKIYMNDNYGFDINGSHLYVGNVMLTGELR